MADRPDITLDDLKTLARGQAPDLAQAIIHFEAQRSLNLTLNLSPAGARELVLSRP